MGKVIERWITGSPDVEGDYWVVWQGDAGPRVIAVSVSPAVLYPNGRLLLKSLGGMAYEYEVNRKRISHYMPMRAPTPPRGGARG